MSHQVLLPLQAQAGGLFSPSLVLFVAFVAIFYFIVIRPQNQQRQAREKLLAGLKKGDRVVTEGGLVGEVVEVKGDLLLLELAKGVRVDILKTSIHQLRVEPGASGDGGKAS